MHIKHIKHISIHIPKCTHTHVQAVTHSQMNEALSKHTVICTAQTEPTWHAMDAPSHQRPSSYRYQTPKILNKCTMYRDCSLFWCQSFLNNQNYYFHSSLSLLWHLAGRGWRGVFTAQMTSDEFSMHDKSVNPLHIKLCKVPQLKILIVMWHNIGALTVIMTCLQADTCLRDMNLI